MVSTVTFSSRLVTRCFSASSCCSASINLSLNSSSSLLLLWMAGVDSTVFVLLSAVGVKRAACLLCQWERRKSPFRNVFGQTGHWMEYKGDAS